MSVLSASLSLAPRHDVLFNAGIRYYLQPFLCLSARVDSNLEGRVSLSWRDAPGGIIRAEFSHCPALDRAFTIGSIAYETAHRTYITAGRRMAPLVFKTRIEASMHDGFAVTRYAAAAEIAAPDAGTAIALRAVYSPGSKGFLLGAEVHINEPLVQASDLWQYVRAARRLARHALMP